jgi:hypothetical protein
MGAACCTYGIKISEYKIWSGSLRKGGYSEDSDVDGKVIWKCLFKLIINQMQQFSSLLSWRLFTAQNISGVFPLIISRPARPRIQHDFHHDTKVKPEDATAVIELLTIRRKKPETGWAVNKHQDNKLENCCIWLVIYLNCTIMYGLTSPKKEMKGALQIVGWGVLTGLIWLRIETGGELVNAVMKFRVP